MRALLALAVMLTIGCGGVAESPVAPTVIRETVFVGPPANPAPPPGPHFALEVQGPGVPVYDGELWVGVVTVAMNPNILRAEQPANIRTTCGGVSNTVVGFVGSQRLSCLLPVGSHPVLVTALMADGRAYATATTAVVSVRPEQRLPMFYDVIDSGQNFTEVSFGFQSFEGATYDWTFGDGDIATTRLNNVRHRYSGQSQERQASVKVTKDGRTIATGSVIGIW